MQSTDAPSSSTPALLFEVVRSDITVVGGGLAGVCAAIAAARAGCSVSLVQNRPVLGGNSSSEVRVWVCGATAHGVQHFARETGIMGELFVENQFRNPDGNPYYWDLVVLEAVQAEPNITLYLNTDVREVEADGPDDARVIRSVTGWQMGSERVVQFVSPTFLDCTGDGLVGYLAGAWYRSGRESRDEFDESWAPETPDRNMLGSTLLFYSKDAGHPVKFVPPAFARDITQTPIPEHRVIRTDMRGCAYWWIEWGGELDIVHDNERIRDELQAVVYGIWDYIKNSGRFDADDLTLEWVGTQPGKREYRRFVGGTTLTQDDIIDQREFEDRVAFGGWSIDLHPVGGVYSSEKSAYHWHPDGNYHLPLRMLYSANVTNMWMAGRNVSATHVAFGGTRVMATCAVLGEAAGLGAALATRHGIAPRDLATDRVDVLRRALVRADASVLGLAQDDPADLARSATVRASSEVRELAVDTSSGRYRLESDLGMVLPVDPSIHGVELRLDADADTDLTIEAWSPSLPQNYLPATRVGRWTVAVAKGEDQWVRTPLAVDGPAPGNVFVIVRANEAIALHTAADNLPGTLFFRHRLADPNDVNGLYFREWKAILHRESVCFRAIGGTGAYRASKAVEGYARPYGGPNLWASEPSGIDPAPWIELAWEDEVSFDELMLVFDDDVEEDLINLHHHITPMEVMPGLVRDYVLERHDGHGWSTIDEVTDNRRRTRRHRFPGGLSARRLRLRVIATNGAPRSHVYAIRAYREQEME